MYKNKKIAYIFVTFGDEFSYLTNKKNPSSFLNKFLKRFTKPKEIKKTKDTHIYELSEKLVSEISKFTEKKCYCFYFNLENMHDRFIDDIQNSNADRFYIFPLFPQYQKDLSLIANFFALNLYDEITDKFFWVKSYHAHPFFIKSVRKNINSILKNHHLDQKDTIFFFLANEHINNSLYIFECETTSQNIIKAFQFAEGNLYFYHEKNLNPLNIENNPRKNLIIIPITTLIDDIKTKNKIDIIKDLLKRQKKDVFICKTLNHNSYFIRSILNIIDDKNFISNKMLTSFES